MKNRINFSFKTKQNNTNSSNINTSSSHITNSCTNLNKVKSFVKDSKEKTRNKQSDSRKLIYLNTEVSNNKANGISFNTISTKNTISNLFQNTKHPMKINKAKIDMPVKPNNETFKETLNLKEFTFKTLDLRSEYTDEKPSLVSNDNKNGILNLNKIISKNKSIGQSNILQISNKYSTIDQTSNQDNSKLRILSQHFSKLTEKYPSDKSVFKFIQDEYKTIINELTSKLTFSSKENYSYKSQLDKVEEEIVILKKEIDLLKQNMNEYNNKSQNDSSPKKSINNMKIMQNNQKSVNDLDGLYFFDTINMDKIRSLSSQQSKPIPKLNLKNIVISNTNMTNTQNKQNKYKKTTNISRSKNVK